MGDGVAGCADAAVPLARIILDELARRKFEEVEAGYLPEAMVNYLATLGWGAPDGVEIRATTQVIAMDEKPAEAVRAKPDSSLVAACRSIGAGHAQAVVSAGNTGAMLAACLDEDYLAWTPAGHLAATDEGRVRLDALLPALLR